MPNVLLFISGIVLFKQQSFSNIAFNSEYGKHFHEQTGENDLKKNPNNWYLLYAENMFEEKMHGRNQNGNFLIVYL